MSSTLIAATADQLEKEVNAAFDRSLVKLIMLMTSTNDSLDKNLNKNISNSASNSLNFRPFFTVFTCTL